MVQRWQRKSSQKILEQSFLDEKKVEGKPGVAKGGILECAQSVGKKLGARKVLEFARMKSESSLRTRKTRFSIFSSVIFPSNPHPIPSQPPLFSL